MFCTTEKIKKNLEHFSENAYDFSLIRKIEEKYDFNLGKTEIIHINTAIFKNNEKINVSGEEISIMCTSDTHIVTFMAPVYRHAFFYENEMATLDYALYKIQSGATKSFQHIFIDGILYVCFGMKSAVLDVGFDQYVFPNAFSYIMSGIEEIGETVKNVRNKLNSAYRSLGY